MGPEGNRFEDGKGTSGGGPSEGFRVGIKVESEAEVEVEAVL